ncbi:MAG: DUF4340 domain-containing protein [Candidatus Zixiibacteriota bacterium]
MKRNLVTLAVVLLVLWGGWYMYSSSEKKELSVTERHDFFWVDTLKVDSVYFKYADWTHLVKRGDRWVVRTPSTEVPANANLLSRVMNSSNTMVLENIISTNPVKSERFEVDTLRGRIMRCFGGGETLAEFVIGKIGGDLSHTYVRRLDSDTVYLARGQFQQLFTMMPDMWKSLTVFEFDSSMVDSIRWSYPDVETKLFRAPDRSWLAWRTGMKEPVPADTTSARARLAAMAPLKVDGYHPEGSPGAPTFDTLGLQLIVNTSDGRADTLICNTLPEGSQKTYARRPGREHPIYIFFGPDYGRIKGRYEDLIGSSAPKAEK